MRPLEGFKRKMKVGKKNKPGKGLQFKFGNLEDPNKILPISHSEIMNELQYKYTGLYALSSKSAHKLLETIGMVVYERLQQLMARVDGDGNNPFKLTHRYRKAHPHFGDFQLILSTLHRIQDECGAPRTQLLESELVAPPTDLGVIDNVPFKDAFQACSKYSEKIVKRVQDYTDAYELAPQEGESEEDAARRTVRAEIVRTMPYLPLLMRQLISDNFTEHKYKLKGIKMRMYGEPYLPGKELTQQLLQKLGGQRVMRWRRVYNMLAFEVAKQDFARAMAADGTRLGGAKVVIRPSDVKLFRMKLPGLGHAGPELLEEEDEWGMEL